MPQPIPAEPITPTIRTVWKTRVSNAWVSPRGTQMPYPGAVIKLRMPHPRYCQREQMLRGCPPPPPPPFRVHCAAGIDRCIKAHPQLGQAEGLHSHLGRQELAKLQRLKAC